MSATPLHRPGRGVTAALGVVLLAAAALTPGCYTAQLGLLRSGLDSLRVEVDTLTVRDAVAYQVLADARRELAQQRDILLSTRATSGSTTQELFDQMSRLEGKLDEAMHRVTSISERTSAPPVVSVQPGSTVQGPGGMPASPSGPAMPGTGAGAPSPSQLYDLATRDLTEGRYALALQGYRDFLRRYPETELADNAQYGVGESFFAEAAFDSAAAEYAKVGERWPKSDRAPAALYKLALSQERLGRMTEAQKSFGNLIRRYPNSSEAGLARDRTGATRH